MVDLGDCGWHDRVDVALDDRIAVQELIAAACEPVALLTEHI
jgi:hypothetical protein